MLALLLLASSLSSPTVRVELVEAPRAARAPGGALTSSARTGGGKAMAVTTALDAERAFAADARTLGQWTAFRKWAAPDATMFVPQPVNAQAWLNDRKDPPASVDRWPTASYVSCDSGLAVNTGGWKRPDGSVGYFSTVWQRQKDGGWKWIVDRGASRVTPRAKSVRPVLRTAACPARPIDPRLIGYRYGGSDDGASRDGSLQYHWWDGGGDNTALKIELWDTHAFVTVIDDRVASSK